MIHDMLLKWDMKWRGKKIVWRKKRKKKSDSRVRSFVRSCMETLMLGQGSASRDGSESVFTRLFLVEVPWI